MDTAYPAFSPVFCASMRTSMSSPSCHHDPELYSYTFAWPCGLAEAPLLSGAPTITRVPSSDMAIEVPEKSPPTSPFMSLPSCVQAPDTASHVVSASDASSPAALTWLFGHS
eukprot:31175-Pelagococcus_subviridis.AAC.12